MDTPLYDAHAHLPSTGFRASDPIGPSLFSLEYSVINGTSPTDWPKVIKLSGEDPSVLPAIGLHPQEVSNAPNDWKKTFLELLSKGVRGIGEIGLDRRNKNDDIEKQTDAFHWQLEQACIRNLPVSVHCVKAIGLLMDTLRTHELPARGVHLHAYNGPTELISELSELGAYFSFNNKQTDSKSTKVMDRIRNVPIQQLLIETDTAHGKNSSVLHDSYKTVADLRGLSLDALSKQVAENFKAYFLKSHNTSNTTRLGA